MIAKRKSVRNLRAITTVYSYLPPEVRRLIDRATRTFPHDVFLRSVSPGLDDFHVPIVKKLVAAHKRDIPDLKDFPYCYPTAGSEEGIREFMTVLQGKGIKQIYMLKGDYEGFREVANTRKIRTKEVPPDANLRRLKRGYWFISNPSARDGMLLPDEFVNGVCRAGHKVFYDLSYLGTTKPHVYDLRHPNITAAAISFSKPYGMFYYRIGFIFSRKPIPALYANKWFKNILSLIFAEHILERLDTETYAKKYKAAQQEIIERIRKETGLPVAPSDAFLLAHLHEDAARDLTLAARKRLERFRRSDWYRFCLTPYFMELENNS